MDILPLANILQQFWPYAHGNFAKMRLPQKQHHRTRLPDASPNTQGDFILHDCLVVRELEEFRLLGEFKLLAKCSRIHPYPMELNSWRLLVT